MGLFKKSRHAKNAKDDYVLPITESEVAPLEYKVNTEGKGAQAPHALTAGEVLGIDSYSQKAGNIEMSGAKTPVSPLDNLRKKVEIREENNKSNLAVKQNKESITVTPKVSTQIKIQKQNESDSLLEKCKPFITEGGNEIPQRPDYVLESVESIINLTEKKFAKLFDELEIDRSSITYDSLKPEESVKVVEPPKSEEPKPIVTEEIKMHRVEIKNEQKSTTDKPIFEDDGLTKKIELPETQVKKEFEDIVSSTRRLDLSAEMFETPPESDKIENLPELSIKEEFIVEDDYVSSSDAKRVAGKLRAKRRNAFLKAFVTILLSAVLSVFLIPDIRIALLSTPKPFYITLTAIFLLILAVNFDAVLEIKSLFTHRKRPEAALGVAGIVSAVYSLLAVGSLVNPFDVIYTCSIAFCFKAIAVFMRHAATLGNFRIIALSGEKYGIKFIDDKQTTFGMAGNAIEGDVLAASSVKTENIQDFLKNTYSDNALLGSMGKVFTVVLLVSFVTAVIYAVSNLSLISFFSFFSICLLIFASPVLMLLEALPYRKASKKMNRFGAMLTGVHAANKLDTANAITITSSQLFPDGTLSLHDMKVLDSNKIDLTLMDAAVITNEIGSPLKGIFNSIAKTNPTVTEKADTIKYEERLGVSGWINDRRIFIGNRTLLEAHGISTPPMEVDRKILRQGYFPVYLAVDGKPCALLVVKYNVKRDIALRLQQLSNLGVTFLVDSCDPNLTDEMICDYFGIYPESVRVMSSFGCQLNKNATAFVENFSAVACYRGGVVGLLDIFCKASRLRKCVKLTSILHIVFSFAFMLYFIYSSLSNTVLLFGGMTVLVVNLILFLLYLIIYLLRKL